MRKRPGRDPGGRPRTLLPGKDSTGQAQGDRSDRWRRRTIDHPLLRSKEKLFAEVVDRSYQKTLLTAPGQNRAVAFGLLSDALPALDGLTLTLRSAANERAAEIMRQHLEQHYQARLADELTGPEATARAALLISICAGIQLMKNVLRSSALQNANVDRLADYLEAALDSIACERDPGQDEADRTGLMPLTRRGSSEAPR